LGRERGRGNKTSTGKVGRATQLNCGAPPVLKRGKSACRELKLVEPDQRSISGLQAWRQLMARPVFFGRWMELRLQLRDTDKTPN
jgi:hypothetical protein